MTGAQRICLADALAEGYEVLRRGGAAMDAVESAIRVLEASVLFNAGAGSRLQLDGARRMDASIMEGCTLRAGAVAGIEQIRHPIAAARLVMEQTTHLLLVGDPATRFGEHFGLELQPPPTRAQRKASNVEVKSRRSFRNMRKLSEDINRRIGLGEMAWETVGAVAVDAERTVAAGASTGGIPLMLPGRVGDTPLIGCGVYADNHAGAVSMTGLGETIIRVAVAKEITDRLAEGLLVDKAARQVLRKLATRVQGTAGALVVTPAGRFAIRHTTQHMCAGYWCGNGQPMIADRYR